MENTDIQRIRHIKLYCEDIIEFRERFGDDYQTFIEDKAYYNSVAMCILQIGELAGGLSEEFREKTQARIPWNLVKSMRNWIAHAYNNVEDEMLWGAACEDAIVLLAFCNEMLEEE